MAIIETHELKDGYFARERSDGRFAVCRPPQEGETQTDIDPFCVVDSLEAAHAKAAADFAQG